MITRTQLIIRAVRKARDGKPPNEAMVYEDNAELLIIQAQHRLAKQIAMDAARRDLLMKSYNLTIVNGKIDLAASTDLMIEALPWSRFFDIEDFSQSFPYIWKRHPGELDRWLNPNFGYFGIENNFLLTRKRGDGDITSSKVSTPGPVTLIVNHVPDFTTAEFPNVLNDEAVDTLAGSLLELRP